MRDAFVRSGFLTVETRDGPDDSAEDEFREVEDKILRRVRNIDFSNVTNLDRGAARAAIGLLVARSLRAEAIGDRTAPVVSSDLLRRSVRDRRVRRLFAKGVGRPAKPGEIEALLQEMSSSWIESRSAHVGGMLHLFNSSQEYLEQFRVELISPERTPCGFVTGDNPVVIARGDGMIEVDSERSTFAMGDAQYVFAPIRRDLAVSLTTGESQEIYAPTSAVVMINNARWRSAFECIGAHPDEDWRRACGGVDTRSAANE